MTEIVEASSTLSSAQSALRFALEILSLVCWGIVGWNVGGSVGRIVLAVVLPLAAAAIWGTFRVPGDESASGDAPVAVRGIVRLLVEFDLLVLPAVFVVVAGWPVLGVFLVIGVLAHYSLTTSRVRWLLAR